jgi:hypothetical protein
MECFECPDEPYTGVDREDDFIAIAGLMGAEMYYSALESLGLTRWMRMMLRFRKTR